MKELSHVRKPYSHRMSKNGLSVDVLYDDCPIMKLGTAILLVNPGIHERIIGALNGAFLSGYADCVLHNDLNKQKEDCTDGET